MFCMDVKALYPSIPNEEGLRACKNALNRRIHPEISTDAVVELIQTVLVNNNFQFDHDNYMQKDGTAIGSKLGMHYACTYMGEWEQDRATETPMCLFRFVDDIWGIWCQSLEELKQFHHTANSIHPDIQVDLRHSVSEIEFLDVMVNIKEGNLNTTIYANETDKHMYLHAKSDHPTTVKNAIPYGLGIRARRICSGER